MIKSAGRSGENCDIGQSEYGSLGKWFKRRGEGVNQVYVLDKNILAMGRNHQCKGPGVSAYMDCSRNSNEAIVTRVKWPRLTLGEDRKWGQIVQGLDSYYKSLAFYSLWSRESRKGFEQRGGITWLIFLQCCYDSIVEKILWGEGIGGEGETY